MPANDMGRRVYSSTVKLLHEPVAVHVVLVDEVLACLRIWEVDLDNELAALIGIDPGLRYASCGEDLSDDDFRHRIHYSFLLFLEKVLDGSCYDIL